MPSTTPPILSLPRSLILGFVAGVLAGLCMLLTMVVLRSAYGVPTPTEMIFDRVFPLVTVKLFIGALVWAGTYSALKLDSTSAALAAQLLVAGIGGSVYAAFLRRHPRRGGTLVLAGVLGVTALFIALLWPNLLTSYRGLPPGRATVISSFGLLASFAVCGLSLMGFYCLLAGEKTPRTAEAPAPETRGVPLARRAFVAGGIGLGVSLVLGGLLRRLYLLGSFHYDGKQYNGPGVQKITPIQPQDEFYQVTKNLVDPDPVRNLWRLEIDGQVDTPRTFTFAELTAMTPVTQETTLMCISYGVGSGLCSNARWTGVPLVDLLNVVKPYGDNGAILFYANDGYYETFHYAKALEPTTLLAYEMNGQPLPPHHGFPLRLIVPGVYGEKNAKWVTRLEVLDRSDPRLLRPQGLGFYHQQGWGPDDTIPTHSRIDSPLVEGLNHFAEPFRVGQTVELSGMAFGGDKGISRVEVSTDDGHTWHDTDIYAPGTDISWSLWRYFWTPDEASNNLVVVVRATNGDGAPQITENRPPVPKGSTGLHRVQAKVLGNEA